MIRSIAAVLAGFFFFGIASYASDALITRALPGAFDANGSPSHASVYALTVAYVALFAVIGGWIAALLAEVRPVAHALAVGGMIFIFGLYGSLADWSAAPAWYHVVLLVLVIPCAWLGGIVAARRSRAA